MPDHTYSVSREELERLRRQVGDLKGQPVAVQHTATLIESMDRLHEALSRLIVIFESANRDMAEEAARGIHDEHGKLDRLLDQNEKIARAVVQLADIVKSQRTEVVRATPAPAQSLPIPATMPSTPALQARDETRQSFIATPAAPAPMPTYSAPQAPPVLPAAPTLSGTPTGLGADMIRPPLPQQIQPVPFQTSVPNIPALPTLPTPQPQTRSLPIAPPPPLDVRSPGNQPLGAPIRPSGTPQMPFPSQPFSPSQPLFANLPPPSNPPRRQTPLAEQNSFMAQPVTPVQPAYASSPDGVLAPLPPPPPPEGKRSLLNRFAFK